MRLQLALAFALVSCSDRVSPEDRALARASRFLAAAQAEDGGFHSQHYGLLKPGYSLTAINLYALGLLPEALRAEHRGVIDRAFAFLCRGTDASGALGTSSAFFDYPNYASAFYLLALTMHRPDGYEQLAKRQVRHLVSVQIVEHNGWTPSDLEYGGFALGGRSVQKPLGADYLNLSVTSWVVTALRRAGVREDSPAIVKARRFIERCQRYPEDGGFVFTTAPRYQVSKAGFEELSDGTKVGRSYGSTTADGVRSLLSCGVPSTEPRMQAALRWLREHRSFERTPGLPVDEPGGERAVRLYYYASIARALAGAGERGPWRAELARKLVSLQRADGAWVGLSPVMKEDDPLIATPLALIALASCGAPGPSRRPR